MFRIGKDRCARQCCASAEKNQHTTTTTSTTTTTIPHPTSPTTNLQRTTVRQTDITEQTVGVLPLPKKAALNNGTVSELNCAELHNVVHFSYKHPIERGSRHFSVLTGVSAKRLRPHVRCVGGEPFFVEHKQQRVIDVLGCLSTVAGVCAQFCLRAGKYQTDRDRETEWNEMKKGGTE